MRDAIDVSRSRSAPRACRRTVASSTDRVLPASARARALRIPGGEEAGEPIRRSYGGLSAPPNPGNEGYRRGGDQRDRPGQPLEGPRACRAVVVGDIGSRRCVVNADGARLGRRGGGGVVGCSPLLVQQGRNVVDLG